MRRSRISAARRSMVINTQSGGVSVRLSFLVVLIAVALTGWAGNAAAQPQLPSTVYGSASIDGRPVPDGTQVRGYIDGNDCTQPSGLTGTVTDGGASGYVINVMHESQRAGCGKDGKTITFTVDGRPAPLSIAWKIGIQRLDLNIGQGQPIALPTLTPVPAGSATIVSTAPAAVSTAARPTGPLPTDDVQFDKPKIGPGGPPVAKSQDSDAPVAAILLLFVALIAVAGGVAGYLLSRRRSSETSDSP